MRIAISGAQCLGKTTLCNDVLDTWKTYKKGPESYRKIVKENNLPLNKDVTKDGQRQILQAQYKDIKQFKQGDKVIFDRCPIDNIVYSIWSLDKNKSDIDEDFIRESIETVKESMRYIDIIFFIPITKAAPVQLEERIMREIDEEYITEIDHLFKAISHQHGRNECPFFHKDDAPPIIEIFGSREERIELLKYYLNTDGDLIETQSSVLDLENLHAAEQLLREQKEAFVEENEFNLIKKGIITDKYNK